MVGSGAELRAGLGCLSREFAYTDESDFGLENNERSRLRKRQHGSVLHANGGSVWRAVQQHAFRLKGQW